MLILDATTGKITVPKTEFNDYMSWAVDYSPNDRFLLLRVSTGLQEDFSNPQPLYVVDTINGETDLEIPSRDGTFIRGASWSPDGKYILTTSGNDDQGAKDTTVVMSSL